MKTNLNKIKKSKYQMNNSLKIKRFYKRMNTFMPKPNMSMASVRVISPIPQKNREFLSYETKQLQRQRTQMLQEKIEKQKSYFDLVLSEQKKKKRDRSKVVKNPLFYQKNTQVLPVIHSLQIMDLMQSYTKRSQRIKRMQDDQKSNQQKMRKARATSFFIKKGRNKSVSKLLEQEDNIKKQIRLSFEMTKKKKEKKKNNINTQSTIKKWMRNQRKKAKNEDSIRLLWSSVMIKKRDIQENQKRSMQILTTIKQKLNAMKRRKGKLFKYQHHQVSNINLVSKVKNKVSKKEGLFKKRVLKPIPNNQRYPDFSKIMLKKKKERSIKNEDFAIFDFLIALNRLKWELISSDDRTNLYWMETRDKLQKLYKRSKRVAKWMLSLVQIILKHLENPDKTAQLFDEFSMLGHTSGNFGISIFIKFILGQVNIILNKYTRAKKFFYQVKAICNLHNFINYKLMCYKHIGICYLSQKKYMKAKNNFAKSLMISLSLKDFKQELYAYDYIGICYYYMGKCDKAHFFHQKMTRGDVEGENSSVRCIGRQRIITLNLIRKALARSVEKEAISESEDYEDQLAIPQTYNVNNKFWDVAYKDDDWTKTFTAHDRHDIASLYIKEKTDQQDYMKHFKRKITKRYKEQIVQRIRTEYNIKHVLEMQSKMPLRDNIIKSHQSPDRELDYFEEEELNFQTKMFAKQDTPYKQYLNETRIQLRTKFQKVEIFVKQQIQELFLYEMQIRNIIKKK